jgi:streptogramin lyase
MQHLAASRLIATVAAALTIAGLLAAAAGAKPAGLIREIPIHGNVGGIAAGPGGNLWFTENVPFPGEGGVIAIGRITPAGKITKFTAGLSKQTEPLEIAGGADGNLWFTYDPGILSSSGGGIGRITPGGLITLFPEPPELHGSPFEIVAGPDGNLWFTHAAILTPTGQAIGRITPAGVITEFDAGLSPTASVTNLVAGPDGNVWFGDDSNHPAVGRITPAGVITEFGGLPPHEFTIFEGPVPGPDGNFWFSANEPAPRVERISPTGTIERFGAGLGPRTSSVGPFAAGADGNVWFRIWKDPRRHQLETEGRLAALGRITPSGRITEFSDCLREMPGYAGPNFLTPGPEGNLWFTTWPSGEDAHPTRASTPSIGRVTPAGKITEFRLGLHQRSSPESLTLAGGRLWFIDRETDSIGTLAPPRVPANTFLLLSPRARGSTVRLPVAVPGPGRLAVRGPGLRQSATSAPRCGQRNVPIIPKGALRRKLHSHGALRVSARITFTPRSGTPFSQKTTVLLRVRTAGARRRAGGRRPSAPASSHRDGRRPARG